MLVLLRKYQPGFGANSFEPNYYVFTEPFCEIVEELMKNLYSTTIPVSAIIESLLAKLNEMNSWTVGIHSVNPIDQSILEELRQLETKGKDRLVLAQDIAKILMHCQIVGLQEIKFRKSRGQQNSQKLEEINYPDALIPEAYLCAIQSVIMTYPLEQTGVGLVDMATVAMYAFKNRFTDMVTRERLPESIAVNQQVLSKIDLFIKKAQIAYFVLFRNTDNNDIYNSEEIQAGLRNEELSYEEFKQQVKDIARRRLDSTHSLSLFTPAEDSSSFPPMDICELFIKYKISVMKPTKKDYEILIRRISAEGSSDDLRTLLTHPILDVINVDIDSTSTNGMSAFDWINQNAKKFPQKTVGYSQCLTMLYRYKDSHIEEATSAASIGRK